MALPTASDNVFPKVILEEAAAPATPSTGEVKVYAKTDGLVYSKDDAGTETLMSSGVASGIAATILDAKGDLIAASAADTAAKLTAGANGTVLKAASGETTGLKWQAGAFYVTRRLLAVSTNANVTDNVNTSTYLAIGAYQFYFDFDLFPATHFHISAFGQSSEAAQTITLQLTQAASPTDPVSASGDDLSITNTNGGHTSGWIAISDTLSGILLMGLARKGSNGTVDLNGRWIDVAFKIV